MCVYSIYFIIDLFIRYIIYKCINIYFIDLQIKMWNDKIQIGYIWGFRLLCS